MSHSNYVAIHTSVSATRRSWHTDTQENDGVTKKALFLGGDAPFVYIGQEKITTAGHTGYGIVGQTYIDSEKITLGERYGSSTDLVRDHLHATLAVLLLLALLLMRSSLSWDGWVH